MGFGRMSVAKAMRFDMLKKPATAAISQMSRSVKPASRSALRSASSISHGCAFNFTAKSLAVLVYLGEPAEIPTPPLPVLGHLSSDRGPANRLAERRLLPR